MTTTPLLGDVALGSVRRGRQSIVLQLLVFLALFWRQGASAEPNQNFHIASLCSERHTVVPLYKKIDGAVLTAEEDRNPDCTVTFQTRSILQRLQLRFVRLALDCNEHLVIFDGAHAAGQHMADLTCETSVSDAGTLLTQSNFATLKYTSDESSTTTAERGFKLVITAFKEGHLHHTEQELPCREFKCSNGFCISSNLTCDGINHCGDNSDETGSASCGGQ